MNAARWTRACGAGVVLLVLLVGVPLVLIRVGGWPLPSKVPNWSHMVTMARQGDIRAEVVTKTVAVVVWIAWLQLAWATVWEFVVNVPAQSSGRRAPMPAPLVAPTVSAGIGRLVAAILAIGLLAGSASAPVAASRTGLASLARSVQADAVVTTAVPTGVVRDGRPVPSRSVSAVVGNQVTWIVGEADTLWDIASAALGDGAHVQRVLELNPTLVPARQLRPGQHILLPAGAHVPPSRSSVVRPEQQARTGAPASPVPPPVNDVPHHGPDDAAGDAVDAHHLVVVEPGDNLWALIDSAVDTPAVADVTAVAAANDGATTTAGPWVFHAEHPEMIHPGQTIDLGPAIVRHLPTPHPVAGFPAAPTPEIPPPSAPVVRAPEVAPIAPAVAATSEPQITAAPAAPTSIAPTSLAPASLKPAPPEPAPVASAPAAGVLVDGLPAGVPADRPQGVAAEDPGDALPVTEVGVAALVAAGAIALLDARRRRALRSAVIGARLVRPRDRDVQTERALRALTAGERLARLDLAVRACALDLASAGARLLTVRISPNGELRLLVDRRVVPPVGIWRLDVADGSWILPAAVPTAALAGAARCAGMACPALVHLGRSGDGQLYVDLEALGALVIETDADTGADIVRSLAASVALSPFATTAHLVSVGIDADLDVESGVVVHQAASLDDALVLAEQSLGSTRAIGRDTSTFALRARSNGGEEWEPAVVFAALHDVPVDLEAVSRRVGAGLAVVIAVTRHDDPSVPPDDGHGEHRVNVNVDGVGLPCADRLPAGAAEITDASDPACWRLRHAGDAFVLEPLGLAVEPCRLSNDALIDVDYLLSSTEDTFHQNGDLNGDQPVDPGGRRSLGPLTDVFGPDQPQRIDDVSSESRATMPQGRSGSCEPFADPRWSLMVRLLGQVEVVATDGTTVAFERSKARELVVWLSQHRRHPTRSGARTALWDLDVRDSTFANVVSDARRALARTVEPPCGEEWLLRTMTEHLPLHDEVRSDAEVLACRSAHARGLADAADAITVLRPGLELVTGMPFAGTAYLWPDAEGITSSLTLLVVGAATDLANRYLELGDSEGVFWATGQGLKVLAGHEELIALRMRAHHRSGDLAGVRHEWETYERALDADPWSSAHPSRKLVDLRRELLTAAS